MIIGRIAEILDGLVSGALSFRQKASSTIISASAVTTNAVVALDGGYDSLTIQINGSAENTARTITWEESIDGTNYTAATGLLSSDFTVFANNTTSKAQIWIFGVTNVKNFRISITAITGGTVEIIASLTRGG